jgi:hypothetical protein
MDPPKVSVVMSVYKGERYLREAVGSILNQTFTDFEFIIVDDGSTDSTWDILTGYDDVRIRLVRNVENTGLTRSLNKGLALVEGQYVARMDADDVALPHKLEQQVAFLEKSPEVGILGTACQVIDANHRERGLWRMPASDLLIRWTSLLNNPFLHPTVMIRRDLLTQHGFKYDEAFRTTQDYELWMRMLQYTSGANLTEPLLQYRLSEGITGSRRKEQLTNHDLVAWRTIQEQIPGFPVTLEQVSQLRATFVGGNEFIPGSCKPDVALGHLYLDMLENFVRYHSGKRGLKTLQRDETLRVARYLGGLPRQPGWVRLAFRLVKINPSLLRFSWGAFLKGVGYHRTKQRALSLLRDLFAQ